MTKIKTALLNEILNFAGKKIEDIYTIYEGRNHNCRCGCAGKYINSNDGEKFEKMLKHINRVKVNEAGNAIRMPVSDSRKFTSLGIEYICNPLDSTEILYVDIPLATGVDRCITIYFNH